MNESSNNTRGLAARLRAIKKPLEKNLVETQFPCDDITSSNLDTSNLLPSDLFPSQSSQLFDDISPATHDPLNSSDETPTIYTKKRKFWRDQNEVVSSIHSHCVNSSNTENELLNKILVPESNEYSGNYNDSHLNPTSNDLELDQNKHQNYEHNLEASTTPIKKFSNCTPEISPQIISPSGTKISPTRIKPPSATYTSTHIESSSVPSTLLTQKNSQVSNSSNSTNNNDILNNSFDKDGNENLQTPTYKAQSNNSEHQNSHSESSDRDENIYTHFLKPSILCPTTLAHFLNEDDKSSNSKEKLQQICHQIEARLISLNSFKPSAPFYDDLTYDETEDVFHTHYQVLRDRFPGLPDRTLYTIGKRIKSYAHKC